MTSVYTTKLHSSKQYGTGRKKKYRTIEQNRKPRNKPMQLYDNRGKAIQWRKDNLFNKWCKENGTATCKK